MKKRGKLKNSEQLEQLNMDLQLRIAQLEKELPNWKKAQSSSSSNSNSKGAELKSLTQRITPTLCQDEVTMKYAGSFMLISSTKFKFNSNIINV